jgi:predicted metalloenzyme YecM
MKRIIGNYEDAILSAEALLHEHSILPVDLVHCDTICYRVETNGRYEELKELLGQKALLLNEVEVNSRLIASFALEQPLEAGTQHSISYIELPQPKPGSEYSEGIDHVQFVTRMPLGQFQIKYQQLPFETKGLASRLNPLLKLEGKQISVKFHDKHMGAVIELEDRL